MSDVQVQLDKSENQIGDEIRKSSTGSESDLEIIENVNIDENSNGSDSELNYEVEKPVAPNNAENDGTTVDDDISNYLEKEETSTDEVISKCSKSSIATSQDQLEESLESQDEDDKAEQIQGYLEDPTKLLSFNEAVDFEPKPLTPEEEELLYGSEARYNAIGNLIMFSILIFTVPLGVMYILYRVLVDTYDWTPDEASFWAGMAAIGVVVIIVTIFVWKALREEQQAEKELEALKKAQ